MLPLSALAFYGVLSAKLNDIQVHHQFLNRLSMIIYFTHMPLINLNMAALNWQSDYSAPSHVVVCLLLTIVEAIVITRLFSFYTAKAVALRTVSNV